jgi:cell division protein FtsX
MPARRTEIENRLRAAAAGKWRFVPKDEALKRMQASEGMAEIVASLPRNPLPDAFIVEPTNTEPEALEIMRKEIAGWPRVAHVQLDSAWVKRFDAFLRLGKLALWMLAGLFAAGLVAVTFNTIRLQVMAQSAEIEVARMIGATDGFIRRPFYYFGALQGRSAACSPPAWSLPRCACWPDRSANWRRSTAAASHCSSRAGSRCRPGGAGRLPRLARCAVVGQPVAAPI